MAILNIPALSKTISNPDEIKSFLDARGVLYEKWHLNIPLPKGANQDSILKAYEGFLKPFMAKGEYKAADVINVSSSTPDIEKIRAQFLKEHTHSEDEIRFFIEGEGLFWFHIGDEVFSILCQADDLISVPTATKHWFDLGANPFVKVIRIFTNPEGWVAQYTDSGIDAKYNPSYE